MNQNKSHRSIQSLKNREIQEEKKMMAWSKYNQLEEKGYAKKNQILKINGSPDMIVETKENKG